MEGISIAVSSLDEKEEQEIVTLVDASDLSDSKALFDHCNTLEPHCLICNGKLVVSARGAMDIFSKEIKTKSRFLSLDFLLGSIVERELIVSDMHSSIICKKCFKLLDDIDAYEVQLTNLKKEVIDKFLQTEEIVKRNSKRVESINYFIKGKKDASAKPPRRGRKAHERRAADSPSEKLKIKVKDESDLLSTFTYEVFPESPAIDGMLADQDNNDDDVEIGTDDIDNIFVVDGLDLHVSEYGIQVGDTLLPTICSETVALKMMEDIPDKKDCRLQCRFCNMKTPLFSDIEFHIYELHSNQMFECEVCKEVCDNSSQLVDHLEQHLLSGRKPYRCQLCSHHFALPRQLRQHLVFHLTKKFCCFKCFKKFKSETSLEEHFNTHTGNKPYSCEHCHKTFTSKPVMKSHMKIHGTRTRPFKCKVCLKLFLTSHHLNDHLQIHQHSKDFVCESCGKAFITQRSLDVHAITHSGVKNFSCRICQKAFLRKGEVDDHERIHTGEKPFQCEICGSQFRQKSNLLTHKRNTHLKEKRYECSHCWKAFKRRRLLTYHIMSVHTGERPYKCHFCKAAFVYPEHFKKHLRIHTGEKPFKCEICGKAFSSKDNKNAHKFIHSEKKQYECIICGLGFMRKPQMVSHIQQHVNIHDPESFIKVNSASIIDAELTQAMESSLEHIQLVRPAGPDTEGVQVLNRSIILDTSEYILPGHVVEVQGDDLEDLTPSQLNHMAEVAAEVATSGATTQASSLPMAQAGGDCGYFQLHLGGERHLTLTKSTFGKQPKTTPNAKKLILYHTS